MTEKNYDVLVIGGGQAGLTAAICAAELGATVCVLEAAPRSHRGGNSRHTRNLRVMHEAPTNVLTDSYLEDEYFDDLLRVTKGVTDEPLARLTIQKSAESTVWLQAQGVHFQPALSGTLQLGRTNAFFLGGGKALMNVLYRRATQLDIDVFYDMPVTAIDMHKGKFEQAYAGSGSASRSFKANALVASAGGFESNLEWLKEAWGPAADNFLIRGTPYNMGAVLKLLLAEGAKQIGDPTQCHAVAIDGRAPKFDGGIVSRVDCVSLGIVVNVNAERFYNEGEDFWPKRYAIWGRLVADQPDQLAYAIIDDKSSNDYMPSVFPPESADSIAELAEILNLDAEKLEQTISEFNSAVIAGTFDHTKLDNCHTAGLAIDKTHWARTINQPPFKAYPLRPGITFTYLGVGVNDQAQMLMSDGTPSANVYAAGEIMAGNVLGQGYLAGIGMTIGSVFGMIAGTEAAKHAGN